MLGVDANAMSLMLYLLLLWGPPQQQQLLAPGGGRSDGRGSSVEIFFSPYVEAPPPEDDGEPDGEPGS